jgi:hypothetical protein
MPSNHFVSVSDRAEFIHKFTDPNYEPFFEFYEDHLKKLNKISLSTGEPVEGNLFYLNHDMHSERSIKPEELFLPKRRALALAVQQFNNVLEIGFNAGHSALLMLTANPSLFLTCIDLCEHEYTMPCIEYLHNIFGNRINLIQGNSLVALPLLKKMTLTFL